MKNIITKIQEFWAQLNKRGRMFAVLALCCVVLLITVLIAALIVHGLTTSETSSSSEDESIVVISSEELVADSDYDKDQNIIDTNEYNTTILEQSEDAGEDYVKNTLFLGDSNTARMYRMFNFCTYANAIGSVGMAAQSLENYACVKFSGYNGYQTMPQAVALMQPERVIITFGTNDLNPNYATDKFIADYQKGIEAVQNAYPSVDIIINAIPPLGQTHASNLTQKQVDEFNKAIVAMCKDKDWKFLNSAEALKDEATGYAKDGFIETSDGVHLTEPAMTALFEYIRTHSYITEDDRPALTAIPTHTDDKDVVVYTAPVVATAKPATAVPQASEEPSYTFWEEVIDPTETEQGYTIYHCNEDPSQDYTDNYTPATGSTQPVVTPEPTPIMTATPQPTADAAAEAAAQAAAQAAADAAASQAAAQAAADAAASQAAADAAASQAAADAAASQAAADAAASQAAAAADAAASQAAADAAASQAAADAAASQAAADAGSSQTVTDPTAGTEVIVSG